MRHDWIRMPDTIKKVCQYGWSPVRTCKNCGAIQTRVSETLWMRVTGYRWLPLVGRCKPKPEKNKKC